MAQADRVSIGARVPRSGNRLRQKLGAAILRSHGWRLDVQLPDEPKLVVLAAPHTSNWDFVFLLAGIFALDLRMSLLAKSSLFVGPFGPMMRAAGALPVDRSSAKGMVTQIADTFAANEQLLLGITPEGTRKRVVHWKSGFWQIARTANVPMACCYIDYATRTVGIGPVLMAGEDFDRDLAVIQAFFRTVTPHTPANFATAQDDAANV